MSDPFATLIIRPGEPGDVARVRTDWTLSFCTSDFARFLTPRADFLRRASQLYWDWQKAVVARLLDRAELWVAAWAEDTSSIAGWCVLEQGGRIVHYVQVGQNYRQHGIAKRLLAPALEHARVTYTHRSLVCRHLPIPPGWTYDPRPALVPQPKETAA